MNGLFLVFEGIEGSGKSTQVELLRRRLAERGLAHDVFREPGGTGVGERIREILLHTDEVAPRTELLLMLAARAALVTERIRPALDAGRVVLLDRYDLSTIAYQGYGRELPLDDVRTLNAFATEGLRPDLTLVLDVPIGEGEARRMQGRRDADRIERAGRAFHERVAEAYALLPDTSAAIERVDGVGPVQRVHARVLERLRSRFPDRFAFEGA